MDSQMETANRHKNVKQSGDDATDIVQRVICIAQRVIRTDQGGGNRCTGLGRDRKLDSGLVLVWCALFHPAENTTQWDTSTHQSKRMSSFSTRARLAQRMELP